MMRLKRADLKPERADSRPARRFEGAELSLKG